VTLSPFFGQFRGFLKVDRKPASLEPIREQIRSQKKEPGNPGKNRIIVRA
jgi:hypothetical protein